MEKSVEVGNTMADIKYRWFNLDICIAKSDSYEDVVKDKDYLIENEIGLVVSVFNHKFSMIQKCDADVLLRHYMFCVENWPQLSDWELKMLLSLVLYETDYGRKVAFWFGDDEAEDAFFKAAGRPHEYAYVTPPDYINVCGACKQGKCITEYVCYTAGLEEAKQIFEKERILSLARARNMNPEDLANDPINFLGDPSDYFQYVPFTWGNCFFGDRSVLERVLGRVIYEEDLKNFFSPTVKFYFRYDDIVDLKEAVLDGYHPIKVRDFVSLSNLLAACVIPQEHKDSLKGFISRDFKNRIVYADRSTCSTIWDWAETAYSAFLEYLDK